MPHHFHFIISSTLFTGFRIKFDSSSGRINLVPRGAEEKERENILIISQKGTMDIYRLY
jgi:hypothetical protein